MEYAQKNLQNVLDLANIDFSEIFYTINNDGSIDTYLAHVKKLGIDFEKAFSLLVLNSSPIQIITFARLNLKKIDLATKQINTIENLCLKSQNEINNDAINKVIFDGEIRPIQQAHLNELNYIKDLLNTALDNFCRVSSQDDEQVNTIKDTNNAIEKRTSSKENSLSEFEEYLSINDMKKIFRVKRNTIYRWEKEGCFKRSTHTNKKVLFKKETIQKFLNTR